MFYNSFIIGFLGVLAPFLCLVRTFRAGFHSAQRSKGSKYGSLYFSSFKKIFYKRERQGGENEARCRAPRLLKQRQSANASETVASGYSDGTAAAHASAASAREWRLQPAAARLCVPAIYMIEAIDRPQCFLRVPRQCYWCASFVQRPWASRR